LLQLVLLHGKGEPDKGFGAWRKIKKIQCSTKKRKPHTGSIMDGGSVESGFDEGSVRREKGGGRKKIELLERKAKL
jgi:hypothetical protein